MKIKTAIAITALLMSIATANAEQKCISLPVSENGSEGICASSNKGIAFQIEDSIDRDQDKLKEIEKQLKFKQKYFENFKKEHNIQ